VDPEQLRALVGGLDREGDRAEEAGSAGASPDSAPIMRLRLAPSMIGQPRPWSSARPFISSRLCWTDLAEADAGIDDDPRAFDPRRLGRRDPLLEPVVDGDQHRPVVARAIPASSRDRPDGASARPGSRPGHQFGRALVPGQRRDVVDHGAPAPSAASITAALRVSIETAVPPAASRLTDRQHPLDLVAFPDRLRARAGSIRRRRRRSPRRLRPWRSRPAPPRPNRRSGRRRRSCRA
jgi:hypothetical protein